MRWLYRARQFWSALTAKPSAQDLVQVSEILSPPLMDLFFQMQDSEQVHSLVIYQQMLAHKEDNQDLLTAALLHDVGKTRYPLRPWDRVVIVLVEALFPKQVDKWGQTEPHGWRRPFVVAKQHAAWGADMAAQAGASPMTVKIIQRHQDDLSNWAPLLEADLEVQLISRLQQLDDEN